MAREHENKSILALRESSLLQLVKVRKELLCLSILSSQEEEQRQGWVFELGPEEWPILAACCFDSFLSLSGHQKQVNI